MSSAVHRQQTKPPSVGFRHVRQRPVLYLMLLLPIAYFLIFCYAPMWGLVISFQEYNPFKGFLASEWVGLANFRKFIGGMDFWPLLRNTFMLNVYSVIFAFPCPILFALMLSEVRWLPFKKTVQTITYLPHFISTVVIVSMLTLLLSPSDGFVNRVIVLFGGEARYFMGRPEYFRSVYILSGIWSGTGWGSIIYLAAITSVDVTLYDAALIDGANRWQRILHITLPCISATISFTLIMRLGQMFSVGFEKVFLMANDANRSVADVLSTYVYRIGIIKSNYSFSTAVGFFNSLINLILVVGANYAVKKMTGSGIW